jgi:hypothetical protein
MQTKPQPLPRNPPTLISLRGLTFRLLAMWLIAPLCSAYLPPDNPFAWVPIVSPMIACALVGLVSLGWSVSFAFRKAWRHAMFASILASTSVLELGIPWAPYSPLTYPGEVTHFLGMKKTYDAQIDSLPSIAPRLIVFVVGGMPDVWDGIVYDETDEVVLSPGDRSPTWRARCGSTDLAYLYSVRRLWSHYYIGTFDVDAHGC